MSATKTAELIKDYICRLHRNIDKKELSGTQWCQRDVQSTYGKLVFWHKGIFVACMRSETVLLSAYDLQDPSSYDISPVLSC